MHDLFNQILLQADWRLLLADHSDQLNTSKANQNSWVFGISHSVVPQKQKEINRPFWRRPL